MLISADDFTRPAAALLYKLPPATSVTGCCHTADYKIIDH
ncbi:hypothetical protein ACP70R_041341 [Stipagrostis hirtigluma subsp. patula]